LTWTEPPARTERRSGGGRCFFSCSSSGLALRWKDIMNLLQDDAALDILFRHARTHHGWRDQPVADAQLRQIYELMKWGPTSANSCPARLIFLRTPEAKERVIPALSPGNVPQVQQAPVTAIIGYDPRFYEKMGKLFPHNPGMAERFANSPQA